MIFNDERGELHSIKKIPFTPEEVLISNNYKNVFRGLHYSPFAKFIYVSKGHIFDVYIDVENNIVNKIELKKGDCLYIPPKHAHGFYCYQETEIIYFLEKSYENKKIHYLTPEFKTDFHFLNEDLIISKADKNADYYKSYKYLILGNSYFLKYLNKNEYLCINDDNINALKENIIKSKCEYVICFTEIINDYLIELCNNIKIHLTIITSFLSKINNCNKYYPNILYISCYNLDDNFKYILNLLEKKTIGSFIL